jgi:cyanate permease
MAFIVGVVFIILVFIFFRDNPEDAGLVPDGSKIKKKIKGIKSSPDRHYTLREAISTYSFWIFALTLTMNALYITGYTFHVTSIFEYSGFDKEMAVAIFLPTSMVAVGFSFSGSWASDYMKLKYLLLLNTAGLLLSMIGFIYLKSPVGIPLVVAGNGISNGMFGILMAVTWPRFFGVKFLGSISGFALSWTVIGSAIGPFMFSLSEKYTGSYVASVKVLIVFSVILFFLAFKANNINDGISNDRPPE